MSEFHAPPSSSTHGPGGPATRPRLRLVRNDLKFAAAADPGVSHAGAVRAAGARTARSAAPVRGDVDEPIRRHDDPRWVLAVMTSEALEGSLLPPEKRERIVRTAERWGLTPFDANLIIAVVQDQARRGVAAGARPAAAEPMLRTISAVQQAEAAPPSPLRTKLRLAWIVLGLLGLELAILAIALG